jgi:hypothetical protein
MLAEEHEMRIEDDVLHIGREATEQQRKEKLTSELGSAFIDRLDSGVVSIVDVPTLKLAVGRDLKALSIDVVELHIRAWVEEQRRNSDAKLLVAVDYLQQIAVDPRVAKAEGQQPSDIWRIGHVAQCLRALASDLDIVIVATAQSNGRVGRQSAENNDLRGSGAAEHEAACVLHLDSLSKAENARAYQYKIHETDGWKLASSLMRVTPKKQRASGHCLPVLLKTEFDFGCRIYELPEADKLAVKDLFDDTHGDPLAWAREKLDPPKHKKGARTNAAPPTPTSADDDPFKGLSGTGD